jgi:hypothetical protein
MKKGKRNVAFVFNSLGEYGNKSAYIELPIGKNASKPTMCICFPITKHSL